MAQSVWCFRSHRRYGTQTVNRMDEELLTYCTEIVKSVLHEPFWYRIDNVRLCVGSHPPSTARTIGNSRAIAVALVLDVAMTTRANGGDAAPSEGTVTVTASGSGTYTQQITAGRHRIVADEPRPIGDDTGPTPYDLLLAGLGACTSMTVRMYANRKGWPLERVQVTLRHSRIHAKTAPSAALSTRRSPLRSTSRRRCLPASSEDDVMIRRVVAGFIAGLV